MIIISTLNLSLIFLLSGLFTNPSKSLHINKFYLGNHRQFGIQNKKIANIQNAKCFIKLYAKSAADEMNWDPNEAPKLNFDEDYYSVLEVSPDSTPQEIKKKYLKLVFKYHPDKY
jgi:hypothetical protein